MTKGIWALAACAVLVAGCDQLVTKPTSVSRTNVAEPTELPQRYNVTESTYDFDETIRRIYEGLDRRDLTIFAVVDHAAGARAAGLEMPEATLVVFGRPQIGTPLMQAEPVLAAELPLRAAVFVDADGKVKLAVTNVRALPRQYDSLSAERTRIETIAQNLEKLAEEATGQG